MMKPAVLAVPILFALATVSYGQRQSTAQEPSSAITIESILVIGKASGACGILNLQLQFQTNTKMTGGDEFVVRFWTTEAARLGMTLEEYATKHCQSSLSSYDRLFELAKKADGPQR
jgi:hypothetical protein